MYCDEAGVWAFRQYETFKENYRRYLCCCDVISCNELYFQQHYSKKAIMREFFCWKVRFKQFHLQYCQ